VNLKDGAKSYAVAEGVNAGVVFWMVPYRTMQCDKAIADLNRIEPELLYVHVKTGERTYEKPEELKKAERRAEQHAALNASAATASTPVKSQWREEIQWGSTHTAFWKCLPITVEIGFPDTIAHAETRNLADFWRARPKDSSERWALFSQLMGTQTILDWAMAYAATRDIPEGAAAPPELGLGTPPEDDPKGDNGSASDEATLTS
jgi:hypothetical protein